MPNDRSKEAMIGAKKARIKETWARANVEQRDMARPKKCTCMHILYIIDTIAHLYGIVVETSMVSRPRASRPATRLVPIVRQL